MNGIEVMLMIGIGEKEKLSKIIEGNLTRFPDEILKDAWNFPTCKKCSTRAKSNQPYFGFRNRMNRISEWYCRKCIKKYYSEQIISELSKETIKSRKIEEENKKEIEKVAKPYIDAGLESLLHMH